MSIYEHILYIVIYVYIYSYMKNFFPGKDKKRANKMQIKIQLY